jgi:hypothetical protein
MEIKKLTIKRFMWMDIIVLTVLAIIVDTVAYFITGWIASETLQEGLMESVFIAPGLCFVFLVYNRWGIKGIVPNVVTLLLQLILYREQIFTSYIYVLMVVIGYLTFILSILVFKYIVKKNRENWLILAVSFAAIYLVMISVEWIVNMILGGVISWDGNFLRHVINLIVSMIIVMVMSFQKKMFVDMKTHLIKMNEKEDFS